MFLTSTGDFMSPTRTHCGRLLKKLKTQLTSAAGTSSFCSLSIMTFSVQKVDGKLGDEDQYCDGGTALRETWENNREQLQKIEESRCRNETRMRNEKRQKKTTETDAMANFTPDDRDAQRKRTTI